MRKKSVAIEPFILLVIFPLTWLGLGNYTAGLLVLAFIFALFLKPKRDIILSVFKDRVLIILLIAFTLNNVISSLFSITKFESTALSLVFFLMILIPTAYVQFSLNKENDFLIKKIIPLSLCIAAVILLYLYSLTVYTYLTQGILFTRHVFYFLGSATAPDILIILGGLGYGWLRQKDTEIYRWYGFLYLLLCFSGIILVFDRGGFISFIIMMILLLCFDYKRLIALVALITLFIILSFVVEPLKTIQRMFDYFYSKYSQDELVAGAQIATFKAAWGIVKDHWLLGVGMNNFSTYSKQYGTGKWYAAAHNFVLQLWSENGLFGLIFGLSIIGLSVYRWIRNIGRYCYRYILIGVGASVVGILLSNMTNLTMWIFKTAVAFWLIVGIINAVHYSVENSNSPVRKSAHS